jgi:hypothetical protein
MIKKNIINTKLILLTLALYFSLIIGFFLDENLNSGAFYDWIHGNQLVINDLSINLKETLLNYESYGHRHSPVYLIILSSFKKLGIQNDLIRIFHLHFSLLLIIIFYKCLCLKFKDIDKNLLVLVSLIIFLSPTFRSLSIWPDSRLPGLLFFTLSIFFYLKFTINNQFIYALLNILSLIVSSYMSPNFSLFYFFFIINFFHKLALRNLITIIFISIILSIPAFYYLFVLKINFFTAGLTPGLNNTAVSLNFNFSNKILIISSIILFHIFPLIIRKNLFFDFFKFFKEKIILILPIFILLVYFFSYDIDFTGGGIFFQFSNLIFNSNIIFFIISFFSLLYILFICSLNKNNFYLIFLLILSNLQNTIYHKYYEPLIIIMFFTIFSNFIKSNFFKEKINILYIYIFSILFILLRVVKNIYF